MRVENIPIIQKEITGTSAFFKSLIPQITIARVQFLSIFHIFELFTVLKWSFYLKLILIKAYITPESISINYYAILLFGISTSICNNFKAKNSRQELNSFFKHILATDIIEIIVLWALLLPPGVPLSASVSAFGSASA